MAGIFPGVCGTQQQGISGEALSGAILTVLNGGTQQLASLFQDIGLTIPSANPLKADTSGRLPYFYVADGVYRVRLTDKDGATDNGGFDFPQVSSIGASVTGTPTSSSVDPTTIATTGDIKSRFESGLITGWVRMNARTIGKSGSGASEYAADDCQLLYVYLWTNFADAICPVTGGRGSNALADFQALKTIQLPDMRGKVVAGVDTMGNAAAGLLAGALFTQGNSAAVASTGGEGSHKLVTGEIPNHNHTLHDPKHHHSTVTARVDLAGGGGTTGLTNNGAGAFDTPDALTGISIDAVGGDGTHNTMPPFALVTWYIKL